MNQCNEEKVRKRVRQDTSSCPSWLKSGVSFYQLPGELKQKRNTFDTQMKRNTKTKSSIYRLTNEDKVKKMEWKNVGC